MSAIVGVKKLRGVGDPPASPCLSATKLRCSRQHDEGGKDSIDHPRGGHDDVANSNSVAGSLGYPFKESGICISDVKEWDGYGYRPQNTPDSWMGQ